MKFAKTGVFFFFLFLASVIQAQSYIGAYQTLERMLNGKEKADFETAIFEIENAYWDGVLSKEVFSVTLDIHEKNIRGLIASNDHSDTMDFGVRLEPGQTYTLKHIRYTPSQKKQLYKNALANWAIFTYLRDTTYSDDGMNTPFSYNMEDPFGMVNWKTSQVRQLLISKKGNCFALTSLFKILSDRLQSDAVISTAPGHIYIQHKDERGDWYNVELASRSHPSDGSIQTLTYTYLEGIQSGLAMRRLDEKGMIALCAVYLAKGYAFKHGIESDPFLLSSAELALKHDPNNLNALLLKHQVLESAVIDYASAHGQVHQGKLELDTFALPYFKALEALTLQLYDKGYHPMPLDMQRTILAGLQYQEGDLPILIENKTPKPFTTIDVDDKANRYSTLSGGIFEELHEHKKYETYGHFTLNTEERYLMKTIETQKAGEQLIDPVVFALSIDPLAHEFPSWSPYTAFKANPIMYIDPDGRAAVNFESPDDVTVNDQGVVTNVERNNDPNRFFDKNGNELHFNDPNNADALQSGAKYNVGDKVFNPVSDTKFNDALSSAGQEPLKYRANGFGVAANYLTAVKSHSEADFTMSFLSKSFPITRGGSDGGSFFRAGFTDQAGYFKFENSNTIFNLYDAGNFMWGAWTRINGYTKIEALIGAHINSLMNIDGFDTDADQKAIIEGINYIDEQ